jgi:type I restriction enzyme S subunit
MTPQELRTSIYQLAFRGKLVAQFPEEGTAEELFSIISTKYLSKKIAAPIVENEDELPFEIPDTWKWVHLNHIATSNLGKTLDKVKNTGELCPYLCSINVYWDGISLEKVKEARFEKAEREKYLLQKGDLLVCEGGDVGRSAIWESDQVMYYQNALHRIRFFADIEPYFYKYLLECYKGMGIIDRYSKGVTIKHLVQNALYAMWLPLPPLAEQRCIVAKLEEILPLIDRYEAAWNKLEEFNKRFPGDMQKSILQLAIQGKLVEQRSEEGTGEELFQQIQAEKQALIKAGKIKKEKPLPEISEDELPFEIPDTWKWVRWGDLSKSIQYGYNAPAQDKGRIKMVRISDIQDGKVLWETVPYCEIKEEEIPTYLLAPNDILFARTGGTVGKSYLVKDVPEDAIYAGYLIRTQYSSMLSPGYMKYFMESKLYWDQLRNGTIATAQPNCNGKTLSKMILPLPPLAEQKRIVAKLEEILPLCDRLK